MTRTGLGPRLRRREGFGFWVVAVVIVLLLLAVPGGASHFQNRQLHRGIVESYLGRVALGAARSAVEEAYYRLQAHLLTPKADPGVSRDWEALLVAIPDDRQYSESIPPRIAWHFLTEAPGHPDDFTLEDIEDVKMTVVSRVFDAGRSLWSGVLEFETAASLKLGAFPGAPAVTRRLLVRKRFFATLADDSQMPRLRFLPEDVSVEVARK